MGKILAFGMDTILYSLINIEINVSNVTDLNYVIVAGTWYS